MRRTSVRHGNSHGPMCPMGIPWERELWAILMGIEIGMGIESTGMRILFLLFKEIPTPSDSYQIYHNLLRIHNNNGTGRLLVYQGLVPLCSSANGNGE